jgi:hypothetical protein
MTIRLIPLEELAQDLGYSGSHSSCRDWLALMRITPVPGRKGWYDPVLVRRRLDEAQGLAPSRVEGTSIEGPELSLTEQRRLRRGKS